MVHGAWLYDAWLHSCMIVYENATITGEGLQNLGLQCSTLMAFEQGRDLYRATPAVTHDLVFWSLPKDRPI